MENTEQNQEARHEAQSEAPLSPMEYITTATGINMALGGPLAEAFSQGLNTLYAKNEDGTGQALESQAVDTGLARRHYIASKQPLLDQTSKAGMSLFYGVQKGTIQIKHVIDIVDHVARLTDRDRRRSAVVVDSYARTIPGLGFRLDNRVALEEAQIKDNESMRQALIKACEVRNIPFYNSFEEFLEKHN